MSGLHRRQWGIPAVLSILVAFLTPALQASAASGDIRVSLFDYYGVTHNGTCCGDRSMMVVDSAGRLWMRAESNYLARRNTDGSWTYFSVTRVSTDALAMAPDGSIWVADGNFVDGPAYLDRVDPDTGAVTRSVEVQPPSYASGWASPTSLSVGADGSIWFSSGGYAVGYLAPGADAATYMPVRGSDPPPNDGYIGYRYLAAAPDGAAYLVDYDARAIYHVHPDGTFTTWWTDGPRTPDSVTVTTDGLAKVGTTGGDLATINGDDLTWSTPLLPGGVRLGYIANLAAGLAGSLWVVSSAHIAGTVSHISSAGGVTAYPLSEATGTYQPYERAPLAVAPDGSVWFNYFFQPEHLFIAGAVSDVVAAVSRDHHLLVRHSGQARWRDLGGDVRSSPSIVQIEGDTLYVAEGPHHQSYIRSDKVGWQMTEDNECRSPTLALEAQAGEAQDIQLLCRQLMTDGSGQSQMGNLDLGEVRYHQLPHWFDFVGGEADTPPHAVYGSMPGVVTDMTGVVDMVTTPSGLQVDSEGHWTSMGIHCLSSPAFTASANRNYVACEDSSHRLRFASQLDQGAWSSWHTVPGTAYGTPAMATRPWGTVELYSRDARGVVQKVHLTAARSGSWSRVGVLRTLYGVGATGAG